MVAGVRTGLAGRRRRGKQDVRLTSWRWSGLPAASPCRPSWSEFHLFRSFVAAQERYEPAPYDGSMALFKATQADTQYLGAGDTLGWDEHIDGAIRVTTIAGSHFSMMAEPGVSQLIAAFRKELDLLDGDPKSPRSRVA